MNEVFEKNRVTSSQFPVLIVEPFHVLWQPQPSLEKFFEFVLKDHQVEMAQILESLDRVTRAINSQAEDDLNFEMSDKLFFKRCVQDLSQRVESIASKGDELFALWSSAVKWAIAQNHIDLCEDLRTAGYRLALLSASDAPLVEWIRAQDLLDLFDVILTRLDVPEPKPKGSAFEAAIHELEVKSSECLVIGSSYAADVVGARRLQIPSLLYDPFHREARSLMDVTDLTQKVVSLDQLKQNRRLHQTKVMYRIEELRSFLLG